MADPKMDPYEMALSYAENAEGDIEAGKLLEHLDAAPFTKEEQEKLPDSYQFALNVLRAFTDVPKPKNISDGVWKGIKDIDMMRLRFVYYMMRLLLKGESDEDGGS